MSNENINNETITVIIKHPGQEPRIVENFANNLKSYQEVVGGYIEVAELPNHSDIDIVMNEEGKLRELESNIVCREYNDIFVGTIIVVGGDEEVGDWCSLTKDQITAAIDYLNRNSI